LFKNKKKRMSVHERVLSSLTESEKTKVREICNGIATKTKSLKLAGIKQEECGITQRNNNDYLNWSVSNVESISTEWMDEMRNTLNSKFGVGSNCVEILTILDQKKIVVVINLSLLFNPNKTNHYPKQQKPTREYDGIISTIVLVIFMIGISYIAIKFYHFVPKH
jgi:hypothetical protein